MRRLYGDLESNSVYREMRSTMGGSPSAEGAPKLSSQQEQHSIFSSLEYNIRMGSGLATVQSAREPVRKWIAAWSSIGNWDNVAMNGP